MPQSLPGKSGTLGAASNWHRDDWRTSATSFSISWWDSFKWSLESKYDSWLRPIVERVGWFAMAIVELVTGRWLHVAVRLHQSWWITRQLRKGDSPLELSLSDRTPVDLAGEVQKLDLALLVKSHSTIPDILNSSLLYACERPWLFGFAHRTLELGADHNARLPGDSRSTLAMVLENAWTWNRGAPTALVTLLIDRGQRLQEARHFVKACEVCSPSALPTLLGAGRSNTTISTAAKSEGLAALNFDQNDSLEAVQLLVAAGAEATAVFQGLRPIHRAARDGSSRLVQFLLDHGAYPNSLSENGETPLDLAQRRRTRGKRIVEVLRAAGGKTSSELKGQEFAGNHGAGSNSAQEVPSGTSDGPKPEEAAPPHDATHRTVESLRVLGLQVGATNADIRRAYRQLVKRYHPDMRRAHPRDSSEVDADRFQQIQDAYDFLRDAGFAQ